MMSIPPLRPSTLKGLCRHVRKHRTEGRLVPIRGAIAIVISHMGLCRREAQAAPTSEGRADLLREARKAAQGASKLSARAAWRSPLG